MTTPPAASFVQRWTGRRGTWLGCVREAKVSIRGVCITAMPRTHTTQGSSLAAHTPMAVPPSPAAERGRGAAGGRI
ncbi:hypothetical protein E2C01_068358 [Portunus trituberculatus]|uniref:Uncharacterized protein n=1 Tax=Portunus trituberculatus TaxID=210409 RepID=A0A5B7HVK5_PORTR|nr:hypothetical protein [Portunus trituberculatus]